MRLSALFFALSLLSSCGFHAIYANDNKIFKNSEEYRQELASIKIEIARNKLNQDLKSNLEKTLNPDEIKSDAKYSISIVLSKSLISTFTTSTGSSGRNKVILTATYKLRDLNTGEIIAVATTDAKDDFDVWDKRFANYIIEESIASNLTIIIAKNIRNLLINDIVNNYKTKKNIVIKKPL